MKREIAFIETDLSSNLFHSSFLFFLANLLHFLSLRVRSCFLWLCQASEKEKKEEEEKIKEKKAHKYVTYIHT